MSSDSWSSFSQLVAQAILCGLVSSSPAHHCRYFLPSLSFFLKKTRWDWWNFWFWTGVTKLWLKCVELVAAAHTTGSTQDVSPSWDKNRINLYTVVVSLPSHRVKWTMLDGLLGGPVAVLWQSHDSDYNTTPEKRSIGKITEVTETSLALQSYQESSLCMDTDTRKWVLTHDLEQAFVCNLLKFNNKNMTINSIFPLLVCCNQFSTPLIMAVYLKWLFLLCLVFQHIIFYLHGICLYITILRQSATYNQMIACLNLITSNSNLEKVSKS